MGVIRIVGHFLSLHVQENRAALFHFLVWPRYSVGKVHNKPVEGFVNRSVNDARADFNS